MEPFAACRRDRWDLTLSIAILFSMQSKIKNIPIITEIKRLDKSENRLKASGRKQTTPMMEASGCVCVRVVWCVCVCACLHECGITQFIYVCTHVWRRTSSSSFNFHFGVCTVCVCMGHVWRDFCFFMFYFLPLCLFNHLSVSICTDIYFFPTVSYNLKLHYSVVAQIVPALDTGRFLRHRSYLAMWW